ncbi:MAG TPA: hypothetical protein VLF93_07235 [Candidatus Saccharimonadales bacterium]|nr:hypothetical protein [Candidatus Saccharimonadales bacterium]
MSEEEVQPQEQQPKKEERVDELDVIGGLLIRFIQKFIKMFKKGNSS